MTHWIVVVLFLLFGLSPISAKVKPEVNFTLAGKIKGQLSGKIILSYQSNSGYKSDTATIKNSFFEFKGYVIEPTSAWLKVDGDESLRVWLESGKLRVILSEEDSQNVQVIGSKTQDELVDFKKHLSPVVYKRDSIRAVIHLIRDSVEELKNADQKQVLEKKENTLWLLLNQQNERITSLRIQYIKCHPKSFIAIEELYELNRNDQIALDSLVAIFNSFDPVVQKGYVGQEIRKDIALKTNNKIGAIAPDFDTVDRNNRVVKLSDFRGKSIVLIDFWASWCSPCRKSFINLRPLYERLHSKGFEIIAVDMDYSGNEKAWAEAIEKDGISMWYHVKAGNDFPRKIAEGDIYSKYFVQAIPRKILIDKDGVIVGNWEGTGENTEKDVANKIKELLE